MRKPLNARSGAASKEPVDRLDKRIPSARARNVTRAEINNQEFRLDRSAEEPLVGALNPTLYPHARLEIREGITQLLAVADKRADCFRWSTEPFVQIYGQRLRFS
jgi:hypothetical protein